MLLRTRTQAASSVVLPPNNTLSSFLEEVEKAIENPDVRSRQFGQMILVLGGTLHLNGCK